MPPNPRVAHAFRAMKELGIAEDLVKPVLKNLLRVYEKNWMPIEEDNYRVLADAIFDYEENKKAAHEKIPESSNDNNMVEDVRKPDEPRKTLKRLRLKYQDQAVSCSENTQVDSGGSSSKRLKINYYGPPDNSHPQLLEPKGKQQDLSQSLVILESLYLKEPKPEPGLDVCPQKEVPNSVTLIKPKDEPLTDDANNNFLCPINIIPPGDFPILNGSAEKRNGLQTDELQPGNGKSSGDGLLASSDDRTNHELAGVSQASCGSVDIASSSIGDIQISMKCNYACRPGFHAPDLDSVLELVEDRYRSAYNVDSSFSIAKLLSDVCNSCLELGSESATEPQQQESQRDLTDEQEAFTGKVNEETDKSSVSTALANVEVVTPEVLMDSVPNDCPSESKHPDEVDVMIGDGDRNEIINGQGQDSSESPLKAPSHLVLPDRNGVINSDQENEKINGQEPVISGNFAVSEPIHPDEIDVISGDRNEVINGQGEDQDGSVPLEKSPLKALSDLVHSDQNGVTNSDQENEKINGQDPVASANFAASEPNDTGVGSVKPNFDVADITKGQEKVRISLVNEVDTSPPPSFFYIPQNLIFQNAYVNASLARIGDEDCCSDCSGDCLSSKVPCACAKETAGEFAYTSDGLVKESILEECISMNRDPKKHCQFYCNDKECPLERSKSGDMVEPCKGHLVRKFIKECWSKCGCDRQCGNRLVQRGITRNLQVFMTPKGKGWGLRTLEDLPKGAFVCEYVGEILTNAELYERNTKSTLKHAYPVLLDADWGSERVLKDEEALCLDATVFGNVARFINHRCFDSNMVEIPVEVETPDRHYYHLAFFTTRDVAAMEELTWDYGIDFDDQEHPVKAFKCSCGSKFCRNIKRTRRRRIR
ncbi:unnamed protein product [Rhodiola kirilowii]